MASDEQPGLVDFLRARLDERETNAWAIHDVTKCDALLYEEDMAAAAARTPECDCGEPARVLADVEAKRRIIEEYRWWWDSAPPEPETDAELHARRAHPAYEYATTEGQRKHFDDADVPPYGEDGEPDYTWERNTDEGRDGWERFDYTEESYWRRRLPDDEVARREKQSSRPPIVLALLALPYASHPAYLEEWKP